jgi:hypothetical protein
MRRRDILQVGVGGIVSLNSQMLALGEESASWSPAVGGLRLGLRLESLSTSGDLLVFLNNVSVTAKDLFLAFGEVQRVDLTASTANRHECPIEQRALYQPCAGLCNMPVIKRLDPGTTWHWKFALVDLLFVPRNTAPYTDLRTLLMRGYSVRASFEMTEQQLKENKLSPEDPWLGRVVSREVRAS